MARARVSIAAFPEVGLLRDAALGGAAGALYDVHNYSSRDSYSRRYERYRD